MNEASGLGIDFSGLRQKRTEGWRRSIKGVEADKIPKAFSVAMDLAEKIRWGLKDLPVEENRMAVVISAWNAKNLLPNTIKETVEQMKASGFKGEIFLILNNGGGDTQEWLKPDLSVDETKEITQRLGLDKVITGKAILWGEHIKDKTKKPCRVELNGNIEKDSTGISLVVIHQPEANENPGKIRGLRDLYGFLNTLSQTQNYNPRYLLAMDAETRLRRVDVVRRAIHSNNVEGLDHLISVSEKGTKMVGAKLEFTPYTADGDPDWDAVNPPMQETVSILHGHPGYEWLPGGATLGSYADMVGIMSSVSMEFPGVRVEDVLTTVMAKLLNIETVVDMDVVHANRCSYISENDAVTGQMYRWLAGGEGLRHLVGPSIAESVLKTKYMAIFKHPLLEKARGKTISIRKLLSVLPEYVSLTGLAKKDPDDFVGGNPKFVK